MTEKYTLQQYAAMQGGHEVEETKNNLSFIESLGEAKMYKTRNQIASDGARGITDHLFVSLMSLYTLSNDYEYAPVAKEYAKRTMSRGNFGQPSPGGTDLYQTLHTLKKPKGLLGGDKDSLLLGKVKVRDAQIKQFMRNIQSGNVTPGQAQAFFFRLEKDLAIQDPKLRAVRRLVQDWPTLTTAQRQLVGTQMNKYFRTSARRSDIAPLMTSFIKGNSLNVAPSKLGKVARRVARGAGAFAAGYIAGKMTGPQNDRRS